MPPSFDDGLTEELKRYVEAHRPGSVNISYGSGLTIRGHLGEQVVSTLQQDDEGRFTVETVVERKGDSSAGDARGTPRVVHLAPSKMKGQLDLLGLSLNGLVGVRGLSKPVWKTWLRSMHGKPIRRASAEAIVTHINAHRAGKKMPPIGLADLH
jgi:hypothetical protein